MFMFNAVGAARGTSIEWRSIKRLCRVLFLDRTLQSLSVAEDGCKAQTAAWHVSQRLIYITTGLQPLLLTAHTRTCQAAASAAF